MQPDIPAQIQIDATGDSSIRCQCGVYVQVPFTSSGELAACPRCNRNISLDLSVAR